MNKIIPFCFVLVLLACSAKRFSTQIEKAIQWSLIETTNTCEARHECAATAIGNTYYLVGGRRIQPTESFDLATRTWTKLATPPLEMHHFQAVAYKGEIYVMGAFTGGYPREKPVPNIWIFNPASKQWRKGPDIPTDRQRGAAGVFVYNDKIYMVAGITDGHWDGHVAWFDVFDPASGQWAKMPDAPRARDHFQAAVINDKLYVAGGRRSSARTQQVFELTVAAVDVFDFKSQRWTTLPADKNLPTLRAGCSSVVLGDHVLIIGGESGSQTKAHSECEGFNTKKQIWETFPPLKTGRHGTQAVNINNKLYIAAGCANRGGSPEQTSIEVY
jgi:N-acetylneuraminic acid mutarotase